MLKAIIDKLDDVEEAFRGLYAKKGEKFELQVEGMKTQGDIDRLQTSLTKERTEHTATKTALTTAQTKLQTFEGINVDELPTQLERLKQLEATAGQTPTQKQIDEMVASRVAAELRTKVGPLERQLQEAKTQLGTVTKENEGLKGSITEGRIGDQLRSEATKAGMQGTAIDDFVSLSLKGFKLDEKGKAITEDGLDVTTFVSDQKKARPFLWPAGNGAGGTGADGKGGHTGPNPFKKGATFNLTEQGRITRENPDLAKQLQTQAAAADTAAKPAA